MFTVQRTLGSYLVVGVVSAHCDGVHDKLAPMIVVRGTGLDIVWIVLRPKVVAQFMGGHQVSFLVKQTHIRIINHIQYCLISQSIKQTFALKYKQSDWLCVIWHNG